MLYNGVSIDSSVELYHPLLLYAIANLSPPYYSPLQLTSATHQAFLMASQGSRRPHAAIEAISTFNAKGDDGQWVSFEYRRLMWVTMQPSLKGAHKVPQRHLSSRSRHWKGRILDFKITKDGKRLALV